MKAPYLPQKWQINCFLLHLHVTYLSTSIIWTFKTFHFYQSNRISLLSLKYDSLLKYIFLPSIPYLQLQTPLKTQLLINMYKNTAQIT